MRLSWGQRQVLLLLLLAMNLIVVSGILELANVARLASEQAAVESAIITQSLVLQVRHVVQEAPENPIETLRTDPRPRAPSRDRARALGRLRLGGGLI